MRVRLLDLALATPLVAMPLTGCAPQDQPSRENLQTFNSIDGANTAVDNILGCEADPAGELVVPTGDGVPLTSAQKLCFENVQLNLYPDQDVLPERSWPTKPSRVAQFTTAGGAIAELAACGRRPVMPIRAPVWALRTVVCQWRSKTRRLRRSSQSRCLGSRECC